VEIDVLVMALDANMTDEQIKDCVQKMIPICLSKKQGFCLTISNFDGDKRELWAIPEAINFMKRLVDFGLIAGLEVSTNSDIGRTVNGSKLPGFGALEVWMAATGQLITGENEITPVIMDEFYKALGEANAKAQALCLEPPYNTGIKILKEDRSIPAGEKIPDAPTRHSCPKWNK